VRRRPHVRLPARRGLGQRRLRRALPAGRGHPRGQRQPARHGRPPPALLAGYGSGHAARRRRRRRPAPDARPPSDAGGRRAGAVLMTAPDRALLLALSAETAEARARLDALAGRAADWVGVLPVDQRAAAVTEMQAFDALAQRLDIVAGLLA